MIQTVKIFACLALVVAFAGKDGFPGRRVGGGSRVQDPVVQDSRCLPSFPVCPI